MALRNLLRAGSGGGGGESTFDADDFADRRRLRESVSAEEGHEAGEYDEVQEDYDDSGGFGSSFRSGLSSTASAIDSGTETAVGATFDNRFLSIQDGSQRAMTGAFRTGQYLSGEDPDADSDDVAAAFGDATSDIRSRLDSTAEDTAFDNPATDAGVWLGDALVATPAQTVAGTLTGVDYGSGETDYRPGAFEVGEIGLIAATGGLGGAAARGGASGGGRLTNLLRRGDDAGEAAARQADDAVTRVADDDVTRLGRGDGPFGGSSDAFNIGSRSADDAAGTATRQSSDVLDVAARSADDAGSTVARATDDAGATVARRGDDSPQWLPSVARSSDDAGSAGARTTSSAGPRAGTRADDAASAGTRMTDDAAGAAARTADDTGGILGGLRGSLGDVGGRLGGRLSRSGDDGAGLLGRLGSRLGRSGSGRSGPGLSSRLFGVRGRTVGAAGAGILGGGALATIAMDGVSPDDAPDEFETADGHTLTMVEGLEPIPEFPNGAGLYSVEKDFQNIGYWVLIGLRGRNVILMDENRETREAKIDVESFQEMAGGGPEGEQ